MSVPYKSTPHGLIAQESNDFWLVTFARFFTDSTTMSLDKISNRILISKRLRNVYYHFCNNRGGWHKPVGVQKLQNQLDFLCQFLS